MRQNSAALPRPSADFWRIQLPPLPFLHPQKPCKEVHGPMVSLDEAR